MTTQSLILPLPTTKSRRVLVTLTGAGCAAVAEDLGLQPRRFVSLLFAGELVAERRYSDDEAVAVRHAYAMVDEQVRRASRVA